MDEEIEQLSIEEYRYIQIIMTEAARLGCFQGIDAEEAIKLYRKIQKIIEKLHKKNS